MASTHFVRTGGTVVVACGSEPFSNARTWKPAGLGRSRLGPAELHVLAQFRFLSVTSSPVGQPGRLSPRRRQEPKRSTNS